MTGRLARRAALGVALAIAAAAAYPASAPPVSAATATTEAPVMGPSLLTADQLLTWYNKKRAGLPPARLPALNNDVRALAQLFIQEGGQEGVRGDMAFVQSMLETGFLTFADNGQIRPEFNNYSGINVFDGRASGTTCAAETAPSRCFETPTLGVRNQIHLLRGDADPLTKGMTDRLRMPPSDRIGLAPIWELFGGNSATGKLIWASAPDYGLRILAMYSEALVLNGANPACLPYFPGVNDAKSGNGYWVVNSDSGVFSYGSAVYYGNTMALKLNQPLINGESLSSGLGYWLLALDGGIFSFGGAQFYGSTGNLKLNQPINGMERTDNDGGYWLVAYDGGVFSFGNAGFYGSTGGIRLNLPVLGMERTKTGNGYWLFAADGGIFSFGDAEFFGSLGATKIAAPIVSMQRTPTGKGYWMLGADGKVYAFGDAPALGDIVGCTNYGGAQRLLVTPTGQGYWIATRDGSVVAFGDARRLGFPTRINGVPVGLLPAK